MKRVVAIVGRPNVGKSTLFNRILQRRDAIVENEPGVTRDRHYGEAEWAGKKFSLVDTGGFVPESSDVFELAIREQAEIAIEESDSLIFVVDARDGLTSIDQEIAVMLRRAGKKVVLVVNKADNEKYDQEAVDFYNMGLGEPYPISAMNGRHIGDMLDIVTEGFPQSDMNDEEEGGPLKIALIGRPNVGKSSITNAMLGQERAIVTPIAGTTRDSIDSTLRYHGEEITLIDTAGLRKRKRVKESVELFSIIRTTRAIERCDVAIVVIDAIEGLERQDAKVIVEAAEKRKGLIIAVNKWDLVEKDTMTSKRFQDAIYEALPTFDYIPITFVSAVTRQRLVKLIELAQQVHAERHKRISTSQLNDVILEAIKNHPPPAVKGHDLRINFIQQPQAAPPVFLCYTNYPELVPENYTRFLEGVIRKHYGFVGAPITIVYKQKNRLRASGYSTKTL
ncbi:MAG: ribosome biogenesis GTPase Der [Armatimonadetes bacterium]|nr:ribosome biogenesis GTPase Der [Armatimonadota bacterium]